MEKTGEKCSHPVMFYVAYDCFIYKLLSQHSSKSHAVLSMLVWDEHIIGWRAVSWTTMEQWFLAVSIIRTTGTYQ